MIFMDSKMQSHANVCWLQTHTPGVVFHFPSLVARKAARAEFCALEDSVLVTALERDKHDNEPSEPDEIN